MEPDAMTLNFFVQHAIPSSFCLVLTIWELLHVRQDRKNVSVALPVTTAYEEVVWGQAVSDLGFFFLPPSWSRPPPLAPSTPPLVVRPPYDR
jgi:hypothetical protein